MLPTHAEESSRITRGGGKLVAPTTPLELPFFDDFAYAPGIPTIRLWEQKTDAVTSYGTAVHPPTLGVLCLDATAADGSIYQGRGSASFLADELVSMPIGLGSKSPSDSIHLTFMVQPGGYGDPPGAADSLLVDFYRQDKAEWETVYDVTYSPKHGRLVQNYRQLGKISDTTYAVGGNATKRFFRVYIPIRESRFFNDEFKFRFRNRASIHHVNDMPARAANGSVWNLDRIYINEAVHYNDSTMSDVGMVTLPSSPFRGYSAVPASVYRIFLAQRVKGEHDSIRMNLWNFDNATRQITMSFLIEELGGKKLRNRMRGDFRPIKAWSPKRYSRAYIYDYEAIESNPVRIRYTAMFRSNDRAPLKWNDTARREVLFDDEYAYDWGIPSIGYGIIGTGAEHAKVAMRFAPLKPTVVTAVRFWFNPIAKPKARKNFVLCIWEDDKGRPGHLIYSKSVKSPSENRDLGRFFEYPLEKPLRLDRPFFVGWRQSVADMMNVGYDVLTDMQPKTFYSTTGGWIPSVYSGALMIRVACDDNAQGVEPSRPTGLCGNAQPTLAIIPNPARDVVRVDCDQPDALLDLYTLSGQILRRGVPVNTPISLEGIRPGVYLVVPSFRNGQRGKAHKLVVR